MKKYVILLSLCVLAACGTGEEKPMETPKDQLVHRLFSFAEKGQIAYGHQDDLPYGHAWRVEDWENDPLDRSDVKAVTGKYPLLAGFDLGGIERADSCNLDGVPFGLIRKAALLHIERGGIVTFSWHPRNPLTGGDTWDVSSDQVVRSILKDGELHGTFMTWLERAADFIESLGPDVAVIFRPWHENTGPWFWWGRGHCTDNEYRELYRLTWAYFTKERGLKNILWCYSPNGPFTPQEYMATYPGDEFVDIVATDLYEFIGPDGLQEAGARFAAMVKDMLTTLCAIGMEHHKLIAFSETGLEGIPDPEWWTEVLYPAIREYPVSYVLTWRNAHDQPGHFYAAWEGFANAPDFKSFSEKEGILFLQ